MSSPARAPDGQTTAGGVVSSPAIALFVVMFAVQANIVVLSPLLPAVAADMEVSTAAVGQLRAVSGGVAGTAAVVLAVWHWPRGLRSLLRTGLWLLATGAAASAGAPTFAVLAAAQIPVGAGLALVLAGALAATGEWPSPNRSRVLAWALAGQPAAWLVGMPLAGTLGGLSWRYAWLALPCAASLLALALVTRRPADVAGPPAPGAHSAWREPGVRRWAAGELLAYAAWSAVLIYAGALLIESYGASTAATGLVLAAAAAAYLAGTFLARRLVDRSAQRLLIAAALVSAILVLTFGSLRLGLGWSAGLLGGLACLGAGRTLAGSAFGLALAPTRRLGVMSVRTACLQYGYLLGATIGGTALAVGGYTGLGLALSGLYLAATIPHFIPPPSQATGS